MSKMTALLGLVLLIATQAFAGEGHWCDGDNRIQCYIITSGLITIAPTIAPSSTTEQSRVEYVNMVREDAAQYVAADGHEAAGAMLQNVLDQVREKSTLASQMTDLSLAKLIESDFN